MQKNNNKKNPKQKQQLRKAIHATIPYSLLPPTSSSQGWQGVNASGERRQRIVCKRRHQTTHKATAPDTSILCTEFLSCHKHTCELTHQVLVDKLTSHLQGFPPPSLYGILAGARGSFCHKFFTLRLHIQVPAANNGAEGYFQHLTLSTNIVFKSLRLTCRLLTGIFA